MIDLKSLLKGTPNEGKESQTPKAARRMDEIEASLVELAEILVGGEE